jgi:4-amino-4-deoxy-L-arabinose transferase-like glycosyltransferase
MGMLAILLPIISFIVLLKRDNFRESFLVAAVANGVFITASTELLSRFDLIARVPLTVCWSLYLGALLVRRFKSKGHDRSVTRAPVPPLGSLLLVLIAGICLITGIVAVTAAPNNFDSLTYHLPRVMHWIQNGNVEHYPTHIDRQLILAPFSEFTIMHLYLLAGGDRFANCVQWFAMVGSAVGVSLIARTLHGSPLCQIISAAIAVSLPMGLLQATTTQNDYAVSFWLVCLVYFIFKSRHHADTRNSLLAGASLALAILTKGTAYLAAAPLMILYAWFLFRQGVKNAVIPIAIAATVVLLMNSGHYWRNFSVYGTAISPGTGNDIICTRFDPPAIISGVTKNIVTQLATGAQGINSALHAAAATLHRAIGIALDDPDLTVDRWFMIVPARHHEDFAPNPLHMILLLAGSGVFIWRRKQIPRDVILGVVAAMASFIVLSAAIKWNPFISRYFLATFIVSAPFVALLFDEGKLRTALVACALLMLSYSFVVLGNNEMKPLAGKNSVFRASRTDQYFMAAPHMKQYFSHLDEMIKKQRIANVGILDRNGNMLEYLLWVMLKDNGIDYRIEHINVKNGSGRIKLEDFILFVPVTI